MSQVAATYGEIPAYLISGKTVHIRWRKGSFTQIFKRKFSMLV